MKAKNLIELLSTMDPEMEVYFSHDSHDYWGSVLPGVAARKICSLAEPRGNWVMPQKGRQRLQGITIHFADRRPDYLNPSARLCLARLCLLIKL